MCWIGKKEEAIRLEAKKDIEVFKIIYKTEKKKYISYYWGFEYKKDMIEKQDLRTSNNFSDSILIHSGFYSYKSLDMLNVTNYTQGINVCIRSINSSERTIDNVSSIYGKDKLIIAKFIIPKGSEYYENQNGEIVSNQIIFKEEVNVPSSH